VSATAAGGTGAALLPGILAATAFVLTLISPPAACSASPRGGAHALGRETSSPQSLLALTNQIRSHGCNRRGGGAPPLRRQSRLDAAAERLASGATLAQATAAAGYRAMSSASLEISGDLSDAALGRVLASRFCAQLTDPALRDIGIYRQGDRLWVLAAAPFATPELTDPRRVAEQVDDLVNQARAAGRRCGRRLFRPAPPLRSSQRLREAALAHSRDMAAHSYLEHTGRDGSTPGARVARTGYRWRVVGENIAAGPSNAREVVDGWLASPEHCANIMDPDFSETAVAYAVDSRSRMGIYWTQDFAAPQQMPRERGTSRSSGHFNH
jgi:uncharacterized protein YkwD